MPPDKILLNSTIFLVDDDYFCSNIYKMELENMGFRNIHMFRSGEECLRNLNTVPNILIIDYDMDALDGCQVVEAIKKTNPSTHVIMISGTENPDVAANAIAAGASRFIKKDGNEFAQLNDTLSRLIQKQQVRFSQSKLYKFPRIASN